MLVSLLKYEFMKRWKILRYGLLGFVLVEAVLLIASKVMLIRSNIPQLLTEKNENINVGAPLVFTILIYFLAIFIISISPSIEGAMSYEKDLSGKQAPLELMIPVPAWKKIASKLITVVCSNIICGIIASVFSLLFIMIMSNFQKSIMDGILEGLKMMLSSPGKGLFVIIEVFFAYSSFFLLLLFCIAVAKWITHKNNLSNLISLLVFVISISLIIFLSIQMEKVPIATIDLYGITLTVSSIIFDIVIFCLLYFSTSFIVENKVEN